MILTREQALEIFKRRVSVRYYDPARKISAEDFAAILDFGRLSPSSVGCEPWQFVVCLLYTSPSPRDRQKSRMPSSA